MQHYLLRRQAPGLPPTPTHWGRLLALLALLLLTSSGAWAQAIRFIPLPVPPAVGVGYANFTDAINDINANFPNGGVTVNVLPGYTETAPAGGLPLLTAQGTAANPIIFQKAVALGANPLITAGVGTLTPASLTAPADGIVRLSGADYVTFNGIDLMDANTTQAAAAEFGYSFFRASATNGCQNNTIQNCVVTMNRSGSASNGLSYGIYLAATDATGTAVTTTTTDGSNSGNRFYTNTILNTQSGIFVSGFAAVSPFTLADQGNDFGGTATGTGNIIRNFGGVAGQTAYGIRASQQAGPNASYNTVENAVGGAATATSLYGVYFIQGQSGNITLNNNTVTLVQAPTATTTNQATAVYSSHVGTGTASLNNNVVSYTVTAGGGVASANARVMIQSINGTAIGALNMNGNQVTYNLSSTAASSAISGNVYGVNCAGSVTGNASLSGNNPITFNITNASTSAITSNVYGVIISPSITVGGNLTASNNVVNHVLALSSTGTTTTGSLVGVVNFSPITGNLVASGNTETFSGSNSSTTFSQAMFGISNQTAGTVGGTTTITGNTVNHGTAANPLTNSVGTTSGSMIGVSNFASLTGAATISNNILTYQGTSTSGTFSSAYTGISSGGATASTLLLDNNTLLGSSTASTGAMNIISATGTSTGLLTVTNNKYQNGTTASTAESYFLAPNSATNNLLVQNNTMSNITRSAAGATFYGYYNFGNAGTGTATIDANTFTNVTLTGATIFYGIYNVTNTTQASVATNNTITGITSGTSASFGIYFASTSFSGAATATGNTITFTTAGAAVTGIAVASQAGTATVTTNTVNLTSTAGTCIGINATSIVPQTINSNTITGISGVAAVTGIIAGGTGLTQTVSQNTIGGLRSTATAMIGLSVTAGTTNTVTRNKLYDFALTGASTVTGLSVSGGTTNNVSNNLVGDLRAPAATSLVAISGLAVSGGTTTNAYYNTIYLNATGGATFGTSGIFLNSTSVILDARNNLVTNTSTAAGAGGYTAALRRISGTAGTAPANYALTSNNNLLYVGTPSATNLLYVEGTTATVTNAQQTLFAYRNFMYTAPGATNSSLIREQRTISQPVTFVSTTGTATNFLMPDASAPIESGAQPIASVTTDYANVMRSATTPDIGAYEGTYTYVDLVAPGIQYTLLANTPSTASRTLTNVAIVDVDPGSGVNVAAGTRPRVYYKISTDANAFNDNTNGTPGWKYVETTGTTSPFSFTIDYSLLPTAPAGGTVIQYFVVAQDGAATPNVAINSGTFATAPGTVALPSAAFPIGIPINQYTITTPLPTTIPVGTGQTYTSLTNAGGLFEAINNNYLVGNTTVTIVSNLAGELGTVALGPLTDNIGGTNNYTLTIQSDGTLRTISGTATVAGGLVRLAGASRVTFTGAQPAASRNLLFSNTTASAPTFALTADASNNTLTNLVVESSNTSTTSGAIVLGSGTSTGNSNNTFTGNDLRGAANATTGTYANGIYSLGTSQAVPNANEVVSRNLLHNFTATGIALSATNANASTGWTIGGATAADGNLVYQEAARAGYIGIQVGTGTGHLISNNSVYQTAGTNTASVVGIALATTASGGNTASFNTIGGSAADGSGTPLALNAGQFSGIQIQGSLTTTANSIQGNVVRNITNTGTSGTFGIIVSSGSANIGTLTGNTVGGDPAVAGTAISVVSGTNGINTQAAAGVVQIANNTVRNLVQTGTTASAPLSGINSLAANTTITVTGNTVRDIRPPAGTVTTAATGIAVGGTGTVATVTNNTVADIVNGAGVSATASVGTVGITVAATGVQTVTGNTVNNVGVNTGTTVQSTSTSFIYLVSGMTITSPAAGSVVARNRVWNVYGASVLPSTGGADQVRALVVAGSGNATFANNQLSLPATPNNSALLYGVIDLSSGTGNYYYNSVYVAPQAAATGTSYSFLRNTSTSTLQLRNNIFDNERGTAGSAYAIATTSVTNFVGSTTTPSTNTSDYNLFFTADATKVGLFGATAYSFAGWKTATNGDGSSMSETSATVPSAGLFANTATGDLSLPAGNVAAWYANGTGTQVASIATDYSGTTPRPTTVAAGAPDIGSTEVTPTSTPPAMTATPAAPALGGAQTFTLGGRTLAVLTYGSTTMRQLAGALPSLVVGRYFSGSNPPTPFLPNARYANAYFTFTDVNGDGSGFTYQPALTYDPASLGTIASEMAQQVSQRKADNSGYDDYPSLVSPAPVRVVTGPNTLSRLGLLAFSDVAAPLPVSLTRFEAVRQEQNAALSWTTASETDNAGFEVQVSVDGQSFRKLGFVTPASPSSLSARSYAFLDRESEKAGLRYYRLQQLDLSGRSSYSPVRTLDFGRVTVSTLSASPNPFSEALTVTIQAPVAATGTALTLTDALGRVVLRQTVDVPAGTSQLTLPGLATLPTGLYVMQLPLGGQVRTVKLIKQ